MNILFLEDRGPAAYYIKESLEKQGHTIFLAPSVLHAKAYWDAEKIDCIIADLNMPPTGLTPEEIEETHGGLLTGWIWLQNYVFLEKPTMRYRTVILSAYIKELRTYVKPKMLADIFIVNKSSLGLLWTSEKRKSVLDYVRLISNQLEEDKE